MEFTAAKAAAASASVAQSKARGDHKDVRLAQFLSYIHAATVKGKYSTWGYCDRFFDSRYFVMNELAKMGYKVNKELGVLGVWYLEVSW